MFIVALHDDVQIAGPPVRVMQALTVLIEHALRVCGLQPTGHKFTLYAPETPGRTPQHGAEVQRLESAIESWTPREALDRGKMLCTAGWHRGCWRANWD